MIPLPKNAIRIDDNLVAYKAEFKGTVYLHIRKTYTDKETGTEAIGKGLSLPPSEWKQLAMHFSALNELANE
jgi:hypothetical protein